MVSLEGHMTLKGAFTLMRGKLRFFEPKMFSFYLLLRAILCIVLKVSLVGIVGKEVTLTIKGETQCWL